MPEQELNERELRYARNGQYVAGVLWNIGIPRQLLDDELVVDYMVNLSRGDEIAEADVNMQGSALLRMLGLKESERTMRHANILLAQSRYTLTHENKTAQSFVDSKIREADYCALLLKDVAVQQESELEDERFWSVWQQFGIVSMFGGAVDCFTDAIEDANDHGLSARKIRGVSLARGMHYFHRMDTASQISLIRVGREQHKLQPLRRSARSFGLISS